MINPNATGSTWILFLRLASAFMTFSSAISVGQTGHIRFLRPFKRCLKKTMTMYMKAMHGPLEQSRTANGKVQHWNEVSWLCPTLTIWPLSPWQKVQNVSELILTNSRCPVGFMHFAPCLRNHLYHIDLNYTIYLLSIYTIHTTQITLALLTI